MRLQIHCVSVTFKRMASRKGDVKKYLKRQSNDEFAVKAREHSYRARSAFKLLEIDDRFQFLRPDSTVLDVGCAPGSWCQVVAERCQLGLPNSSGYLLGVDLALVLPIRGADILSQSDITAASTQAEIQKRLAGRDVDVVLSDMAPSPTGDAATDHLRLVELCLKVFRLFHPARSSSVVEAVVPSTSMGSPAERPTEPAFKMSRNGVFVCKIWDGVGRKAFIEELSTAFRVVKTVKPTACRDSSAELYLYCSKLLHG